MTNATSSRLIHEGAVVALVEGKIEALQRRIEEGRAKTAEAEAQISALRTVVQGLKWIGDPITVADDSCEFPFGDRPPRYVVRETGGGIARWAVIDTQYDYAVTTFFGRDEAETACHYRNRTT